MRIQGLAGAGCNCVYTGIVRLRQSLAGSWNRSSQAVHTYSKGICGRCGSAVVARAVHIGGEALHRLDQACAQQWHQHQVNTIQPAIDPAIAATNDSGVMSKDSAKHGVAIEVRIPCRSDARAERAVEGK